MKRTIFIFILLAGLAAFAQTLHYTKTENGNTLWSYDDGVFTFNSAYVWTDFAARIDYKASGSAARSDVKMSDLVEFGYYLIEDGKAGQAMPLFVSGEEGIRNSAIFNDGDKIGIYAKIQSTTDGGWERQEVGHYNKKGKWIIDGYEWVKVPGETKTETWTTTANAIEGARKNANNVDHDSLHEETQYFCLFLDHFSLKDHFEYYMAGMVAGDDYNQFISDVIDQNIGADGKPITVITDGGTGEPITTGQPLPGVLASVMIGSSVLLVGRKARKTNKSI